MLGQKEMETLLRLQDLMERVQDLDPGHPSFPGELRKIGQAFQDAADVLERAQAERKPS